MPLTSSSTIAQVQAAIEDNCSFDTPPGSLSQARDYLQALRIKAARLPQSHAQGGVALTYDLKMLRDEIMRVEAWIGANDTAQPRNNATVFHRMTRT